ncbi:MAG TPA: ribonuclease P protein component [Vicingus sp.]|nr:MAG: ribonuclease P protein component [Flavobacteriales bacterium]MCL4857251.1 ribonuclease P protein component [Flavobacteriales bacterium]HRN40552.1 ribonuclease P protein component [Vicingus sp.]
MQPSHKFPKIEKLKSTKDLDELFGSGKSIHEPPIRAIYKKKTEKSNVTLSVGVSAPKKLIKLAVNRNLIKRRIREAYRLNNHQLKQTLIDSETQLNIMFVYTSKQLFSYNEIEDKIKVILNRLNELFSNANK